MATLNSAHVRDNSTLTNFKDWAQSISNAFSTFGWTQSADTGQVNWSTIASVPAVNTYVYEIWEPNDGLTNFFLKVEYGTNTASANTGPSMRVSIGTSTNGAGTLSGLVAGPFTLPTAATSVTSTVTTWNCYFSGAAGRIGVAMWVTDTTNNGPMFFTVARSKNSSGANTSSHVSLIVCSQNTLSRANGMQTIVFGTGVTNKIDPTVSAAASLPVLSTSLASNLFASTDVPISPVFPLVGFYDNPLIEVGSAAVNDITDQATFTIAAANSPYGASHTYIGLRGTSTTFAQFGNPLQGNNALVMLYE